MQKEIVKDVLFLSQKAVDAQPTDVAVGQDLVDTLLANKANCVGLAANMIGVNKKVIVIDTGFVPLVMYNPVIVAKEEPYQTEESCLSLVGSRPTTRYKTITVEYFDSKWDKKSVTLSDFTAQICQHECDHLAGIII